MKALTEQKEIVRGAPSPELVDLWLARAFNAHDVEAAAAMYHPDATVVRLDQVMAPRQWRAAPWGFEKPWRATSG
jgi:ketosteroid isomerase-like protein